MESKFWLNKWKSKQIGFHYDRPNPQLIVHFEKLKLTKGDNILLPLCGKTADLFWLISQGIKVYGVELSKIAIEEFFQENNLEYNTRTDGEFEVYFNSKIEIYHGDFFAFYQSTGLSFSAIFDRASLVALPIEMRKKYYLEIKKLLKPKGRYFLISFEYDQSQMDGPPFSVTASEIFSNLNFIKLEEERTVDHNMSDRAKTEFYNCRYIFEK